MSLSLGLLTGLLRSLPDTHCNCYQPGLNTSPLLDPDTNPVSGYLEDEPKNSRTESVGSSLAGESRHSVSLCPPQMFLCPSHRQENQGSERWHKLVPATQH